VAVAAEAEAKADEWVSRFLRWTRKRRPEEEERVISASGAQTWEMGMV
jgi:hypothetical protein